MSYFSAALEAIIRSKNITQSELAKKASVHQGQLSRYLSEDVRPDSEALRRLSDALGQDGPDLVVAFLRDLIPDSLRGLILISMNRTATPQDAARPDAFNRLSVREQELIHRLAGEFEKSPEFVTVIEATLNLLRSREG